MVCVCRIIIPIHFPKKVSEHINYKSNSKVKHNKKKTSYCLVAGQFLPCVFTKSHTNQNPTMNMTRLNLKNKFYWFIILFFLAQTLRNGNTEKIQRVTSLELSPAGFSLIRMSYTSISYGLSSRHYKYCLPPSK